MRTLIRAWRVRHGFAFDRPRLHGTALEQMAEGARSNADFARWAAKIVAIRHAYQAVAIIIGNPQTTAGAR